MLLNFVLSPLTGLSRSPSLFLKKIKFSSTSPQANDELAALWAGQALDKVAYAPHAAVVSDSGGSGGSGGLAPARHWVYLRDHKADRWLAFDDDEVRYMCAVVGC